MNIYVGNLPYSVREQELRSMFEAYGEVTSASVAMDKATGKSRGFGFVEMSGDEEARQAIEAVNGTQQGGRTLVANEARPREDRPRGGGGGGVYGGGGGGGSRGGGGGYGGGGGGGRDGGGGYGGGGGRDGGGGGGRDGGGGGRGRDY